MASAIRSIPFSMLAIEVAYEIRMWASLPNSTPGTTAIRAVFSR